MRQVEALEFNVAQVLELIADLEILLGQRDSLSERDDILPFFAARLDRVLSLGLLNPELAVPTCAAVELSLFGDFVCDAVVGDSASQTFTFIEFEDAGPTSLFARAPGPGRRRPWGARFEKGFSQIVDWAWRLDDEGSSNAIETMLGCRNPAISYMLVIGRDTHLNDRDRDRLRWRAAHVGVKGARVNCMTFDRMLALLRARAMFATRRP